MRCRGLQEVANTPFLKGFPFSALRRVAPYCFPGGVRLVSGAVGCVLSLPCLPGASVLFRIEVVWFGSRTRSG